MRIKDQRGQAELLGFIAVALVAVLAVWAFSKSYSVHRHSVKPTTAHVQIEKLKPVCSGTSCKGTYAYHDTNGGWWYYYFMFNATNPSGGNSYSSYGNSLPSGGSWSRSSVAPPREQVEEENDPMDISEEADGTPETTEEAATEAAQSTETESTTSESSSSESASSDSSSSSSDSGSSGGDSGGGGDGGGGGGGGD